MKRIFFSFGLTLLCFTFAVAARQKKAPPSGNSLFVQDKGKFTIQLDGKTVGHEDFEFYPSGTNWVAHGTTDIKTSDSPAVQVTGTLALQPDGAPITYDWASHSDKTNGAHIAFNNGNAKVTLQMQGARPFEQEMNFGSPIVAVLDNNLYDQYAVLARLYNWSQGGSQTMPVIIPQDLAPGTITVESVGPQNVDGKSYERLRVTTSDLQVLLYLDNTYRLMRLEVSTAKVSVFRE